MVKWIKIIQLTIGALNTSKIVFTFYKYVVKI